MDNSQGFERGLDIWKLQEDGPVRDLLVVQHEADTPDGGREADVLGAGQVVEDNLSFVLGCHVVYIKVGR